MQKGFTIRIPERDSTVSTKKASDLRRPSSRLRTAKENPPRSSGFPNKLVDAS